MSNKDKFIFISILVILFLIDIGSKRYVFDYFSVVISDAPQGEDMQKLYDGSPKVYVKKDYQPLEIVESFYSFSFPEKYQSELSFFYVSDTIKEIFSKNGYHLSDKAYVVPEKIDSWKITDWKIGKRFFITKKDQEFQVTSSFFSFLVVINRGAIWGIMQGKTIILTLFSVLAILFILYIVFKNESSKPYLVPLSFISSGAFGNLWDRIFFNGVRDFLDFNLGFMQWPTFNFADVFIVTGVILYLIIELYISIKTKNERIKTS